MNTQERISRLTNALEEQARHINSRAWKCNKNELSRRVGAIVTLAGKLLLEVNDEED